MFLLAFLASITMSAAAELVHVQPFTLAEPGPYHWTANPMELREGTLFVLKVAPEQARQKPVGSPVLYVGAMPAERVNHGDRDGHIVAFVPGHVDLGTTPVFWGPSTLPERVDAAAGAKALAAADPLVFAGGEIQAAAEAHLSLADKDALYALALSLIRTHAPQEAAITGAGLKP